MGESAEFSYFSITSSPFELLSNSAAGVLKGTAWRKDKEGLYSEGGKKTDQIPQNMTYSSIERSPPLVRPLDG